MADDDKIWIGQNGEKFGPYSEASICEWLKEGKLTAGAMAWRNGMESWVSLGTMLPAAIAAESPPPLIAMPASSSNSRSPNSRSPAPSRASWWIGGVVLVLVAVALAAWLDLKQQPASSEVVAEPATPEPTNLGADNSAYQDYLIRSQVTEGALLADSPKIFVSETYGNSGTFPLDNAAASLPPASSISGKYVSSVKVVSGAIVVAFNNSNSNIDIRDKIFVLTPEATNGRITWRCNDSTVPAKYLPSSCQ